MEAKNTMIDVIEYGTGKTIPMNAQEAINLSSKAGIEKVLGYIGKNITYARGQPYFVISGYEWQALLKLRED